MKFKRALMCLMAATVVWTSYPATQTSAAAAVTTGTIQYGVNFRTEPSASSKIIRMIGKGEDVVVLNKHNNYWWRVQDVFGTIGYISTDSKYLKVNGTSVLPGGGSPATGTNATIVSGVSFRTGPSTSASRIRYLSKGEQVTVTGQHNAYWYAVRDSRGQTGYVSTSSKYINVGGSIGTPPPVSNPGTGSPSTRVEAIIAAGMKYLGTPYEFGSKRDDPRTFDCSDLIRQMFRDATGIVLPADSRQQGSYVRNKNSVTTDWRKLKRGDLMFFMDYKGTSASQYSGKKPFSTRISHVAIYLGEGKVLHTYSKQSGGVRTDSIAGKHWEHRFLYGGSAL
ncbi:SH3 domain-containing protein [Paenibacillaceae bacterium WGS1546]|uniref:C40 family peptidase n=1 Tax=Cohnella sp. WGS1546 TaxID=3366810 RepID=UPI00372D5ACB